MVCLGLWPISAIPVPYTAALEPLPPLSLFLRKSLFNLCPFCPLPLQHYKQVFEPLILEECCAQMLRGVEEGEVLTPHM